MDSIMYLGRFADYLVTPTGSFVPLCAFGAPQKRRSGDENDPYTLRSLRIQDACVVAYPDSAVCNPQVAFPNLYVSEEYQYITCAVHSYDWMALMSGIYGQEIILDRRSAFWSWFLGRHRPLSSYPVDVAKEKLESYTRFMIGVDPRHRLVETYLTHFNSTKSRSALFQKHASDIAKRFRKSPEKDGSMNITFSEFSLYVGDTIRRGVPDPVWTPLHQLCQPCGIDYFIIARIDSLVSDISILSKYLSIPRKSPPPDWHKLNPVTSASQRTFLGQLSLHEMHQLYHSFSQDFLMFNVGDGKIMHALGFPILRY